MLLPNRWLTAKWHMPRKVAGTAAKGMEGWGKFQEGLIVRCQIVVALFLLLSSGTGASAECAESPLLVVTHRTARAAEVSRIAPARECPLS